MALLIKEFPKREYSYNILHLLPSKGDYLKIYRIESVFLALVVVMSPNENITLSL
jgi:hypothetical protein